MLKLVKRQFFLVFMLTGMVAEVAIAQNYPNKPITLIVPYGVGGDSDFSGRNLVPIASKLLGQNVIVQSVARMERSAIRGRHGSGVPVLHLRFHTGYKQ